MTTRPFPRIVVGYDGSPAAQLALHRATERAGTSGEVVVAHAFEPPHDWLGHPNYDRVLEDHRARGRAMPQSRPS